VARDYRTAPGPRANGETRGLLRQRRKGASRSLGKLHVRGLFAATAGVVDDLEGDLVARSEDTPASDRGRKAA
jgi:hypothetical protein